MKQICKCNPDKGDLGFVIPNLYPDLNEVIMNGVIPDTTAEVVYNQITELSSVGFRVNDDFDAIMISRGLKTAGITPNQGHGSSQQAGSSAPVASTGSSQPSE